MATGKKRIFQDADGNQTLGGSVIKAHVGADNRTTITGLASDFTNEQFLGASVVSFNCRVGWGAEASELSVELVEDDCRFEKFTPPAIGAPVSFRYSAFEFGGILTNWEGRTDTSGRKISVKLRSPSVVLSNAQIILKGADDFEPAGNIISVSGGDSFCRETSIKWSVLKSKIQTTTFTYKGYDYIVDTSDVPGDIPFDGDSISVLEAINRAASAQSLQIYVDFITGDKDFIVELPDGTTVTAPSNSNFIKIRTHNSAANTTYATAIDDDAGSGSSGFSRITKGSVLNTSGLLKYIPGATVGSDGTVNQQCSVVEENAAGQVLSETFYTPNSLVSFSAGVESADVCTHAVINGGPVEAIWRIKHDDTYEPETSFESATVEKSTIYHYWGKDPDTNGILISEVKPDTKIEVGVQKQIFHELLEEDKYTMDLLEMRTATQGYQVWYDYMANTCEVEQQTAVTLENGKIKLFDDCTKGKSFLLSKFTGMPTYAQSSFVSKAIRAVIGNNNTRPSQEADPDGDGVINLSETFAVKKKEMEENGNLKKLQALHSFVSGFAAKYGQQYFVRLPDDLFFCCTTDLEGVITDNPGPGNWEQTGSGWHPQSDTDNAYVLNEELKWNSSALSNFVDEQGKCKTILEFDYNPDEDKTTLEDPSTEQEVEVDFEKIASSTQHHSISKKKVFLEANFERIYRSCDANAFAETAEEDEGEEDEVQVKVSGAVVSVSGGVQVTLKEDPEKGVVGQHDALLAVLYNNKVEDNDKISKKDPDTGEWTTNTVEPKDEKGKPLPNETIYSRFKDLVKRHGSDLKGNSLGGAFLSPISAAIPLKSNQLRYGPKEYTSANPTSGRSEYDSNTSLVPWEFGSLTAMNLAFDLLGQTKVSSQTLLESGSVKFTGTPGQIGISRLGDALIDGGPNITGVSITVGMGGITTDVNFRTYTRSFGELAQNKIEMLSRMGQAQQRLQKAFNTKIAERYALAVTKKLDELEYPKDKKVEEEERNKKNSPKSNTSIVTQNHRIDSGPATATDEGLESSGSSTSSISDYRFNTSVSIETTVETSENLNSASSKDGTGDGEDERKADYKRKASCSLDSFFRPYKVGYGGDDFLMPELLDGPVSKIEGGTYDCVGDLEVGYGESSSFNNGITYFEAKGCCTTGGDVAVSYNITSGALNPFISKSDAASAGVINAGTAPCKRVTRGSSYPTEGLTVGEGNAIAESPQEEQEVIDLEDVRSVGLAGPLIIVGWGYDTDGNPVPRKSGSTDSEEDSLPQFEDDWTNKPHLWKAGPLDIRWDATKTMWVANVPERPVGYIIEGSLSEDLEPGGTGTVNLVPGPQDFYQRDPDVEPVTSVTATNRLGQPLCKGQGVFAYYNPFSCEYVILQAEFIPVTVVTDMCAYAQEDENTTGCLDLVATTRIIYVQSPPSVAVQTRWAQVRACDSCPSTDNPVCKEEIIKIIEEYMEESA